MELVLAAAIEAIEQNSRELSKEFPLTGLVFDHPILALKFSAGCAGCATEANYESGAAGCPFVAAHWLACVISITQFFS
ncbi:MAG TPA: hypothetical protein VL527_12955 [Dongiaceae bacterium]|nr:hypothetical protein [Dongiaceae bacterium]